jgi:hypothetical protein
MSLERSPTPAAPILESPIKQQTRPGIKWNDSVVGFLEKPQLWIDALQGNFVPAQTQIASAFMAIVQTGAKVEIQLDEAGIAWYRNMQPGRCQEDYDANMSVLPGLLLVKSLSDGIIRIHEYDSYHIQPTRESSTGRTADNHGRHLPPLIVLNNDEIAVLRCSLSPNTRPLVVWPATMLPGGGHSKSDLAEIAGRLLKVTTLGLDAETIADFLEANRQPWPITPDLVFDEHMVCLSSEELAEMKSSRDNWWERFREQHPGVTELVEFSRVGFNRNRTQALLYAGSRMNWNAGQGGYHVLAKSETGWSRVASELAWVS